LDRRENGKERNESPVKQEETQDNPVSQMLRNYMFQEGR
jgi:hypothetical protein